MKKREKKSVLAEGEVTGHCHKLTKEVDVWEDDDGMGEFTIDEPTELVHEEHGTITIPVKKWRTDKVREYDHFAEEAKKVRD